MTFDYGDYLRECFSQPLLALLWTLPFILFFLIPAILALWRARRSPERRPTGRLILLILCILVIIGFPLCKQLGTLLNTNGIAILLDNHAEPLALTGVIESIRNPERNADTRFTYAGENHYGVWLTISGTAYYAVTAGELRVGDTTALQYLPKSRCVIWIAPAESTLLEE